MFYKMLLLFFLYPIVSSATCYFGQYTSDDQCLECTPGQYQDERNQTSCKECPSNTFNTMSGSAYCVPCLAETYALAGQQECSPCATQTSGTCCDGFAPSDGICTACAPGTYQSGTQCLECPIGFVSNSGSTSCSACEQHEIVFTSQNISTCIPCAGGHVKINATHCQPCEQGYYESDNICTHCPQGFISEQASTECQLCEAGTFSSVSSCTPCPNGTKSPPGAGSCSETCPTWTNGSIGNECLLCASGYIGESCTPCAPGFFKELSIGPTCDECPIGFVSDEAATICTACAAGSFETQNQCVDCPNGFVQPLKAQSMCVVSVCPSGTHSQQTGLIECIDCAPGRYQDVFDSQDQCKQCPAGRYIETPGAYQCHECPVGFGSNGTVPCASCLAGYATVSGQCQQCPLGWVSDGTTACVECARGFFSGESRCEQCPLGRYQSERGQSECDACDGAQQQTNIIGTGSWACLDCATSAECEVQCGPGFVWSNNACEACPTGKISFSGAQTECTECTPGFFSDTSICRACAPGQYQNQASSDACILCPAGFSASSGRAECEACPLGRIQPLAGQSECEQCAPGRTSDGGVCVDCPEGQPHVVNGVCVLCPLGSVLDDNACVPCSDGQTSVDGVCRDCVPGQYAKNGICNHCAPGQFNNAFGQTSCKNCASATSSLECDGCAAGFFKTVTSDCEACPAGYWSSSRSDRCAMCSMGQFQSSSGSSSCRSCVAGAFQPLEGSVTCRFCPAGWFQGDTGQGACHACPRSHYAVGSGNIECQACASGKGSVRGALISPDDCETCPAGTFSEQGICQTCPEGYYQQYEGQTKCKTCQVGYLSQQGSTDASSCFNVARMTTYVFGMVGDAKPAQSKTFTCEIRPNFVLLCPGCTCDDDSRNGFWTGPICDECRRGFATKTCTTICPGYDGTNDNTMCSGNGKCWFGKNGNGLCYCGGHGELDKTTDNTVVDVQLCPKGKICPGYGPDPQTETNYKPMYYIFKYRQYSVFVLQISTFTPERGHMWFKRFPPELAHVNECKHCVSRYDPKNRPRTVIGGYYDLGGEYERFDLALQTPNGFHGENCQHECAACLHSGYCNNVPHQNKYVYEIVDTFRPQVPVYIPKTTCICPSIIYDSDNMCCPNGFQPYVYYGHKDSTPYSRFSTMPYITSLSNVRQDFWINKDLWLEPDYGFASYSIPGSPEAPGDIYVSKNANIDTVPYLTSGPYNKHVYHGVPRDICRACPGLFGKGVRLQAQRVEDEESAENVWWDNSMGASARKCNGVGVCDFYSKSAEPTVHFMGDATKYTMVHRGRYCIREDEQDLQTSIAVALSFDECIAHAHELGAEFIAVQEDYIGGTAEQLSQESYVHRDDAVQAARLATATAIAKLQNGSSVVYYVVEGSLPIPDSNAPYVIQPILTQDTCSVFFKCRRTTLNPRFNVYKMEKGRGEDRMTSATYNRFDTCFTYSFESNVQTFGLFQTIDYVQGEDPFLGGLCPVGHYCSVYENIGYKEACPAGYYQPLQAMTRTRTAIQCATSNFPQGDCIPNAATSAFDDYVDPVCIRCPRNEYALPGSEICHACPVGRVKKFSGEWDTSTKMLNMETFTEPGYDPWYYTPDEMGIMENDCALVPAGIVHLSELNPLFNIDNYDRNPRFLPVLSCPYGYSSFPGSRAVGNIDDILDSITTYRPAIEPPFVEFGLTYTFETITSGNCADYGWFEIDDRAVCAAAALEVGLVTTFTQPSHRTGYMGCYKHQAWGDKNVIQFSDATYVSEESCVSRKNTTTICQVGKRREGMMSKFTRAYCFRCPGDAITGPQSMTCTSCYQSKSKTYTKEAVQIFAERNFLQDVVVRQNNVQVAEGISYLASAFANIHLIRHVINDVSQKCTNPASIVTARFANDPQVFKLSDCVLICSMRNEYEYIGHSAKGCWCASSCSNVPNTDPSLFDPVWYKNLYALEHTTIQVQVNQNGRTSDKTFTISDFDAEDWKLLQNGCPTPDIVASGYAFDKRTCAFVCTRMQRPFFMTFSGNQCQCGVELDATDCTTYANEVYTNNGVVDTTVDIAPLTNDHLGWSTAMPLCANCQPGFWRNPDATDNLCTKCEPGYFTSTDVVANSFLPCNSCGLGTYQDERGSSECKSCAPGFFNLNTAQAECSSCPIGYHQNGLGATSCKQCETGRYSDENALVQCKGCPPGRRASTGNTLEDACQECAHGQYQDGYAKSVCHACPPGQFGNDIGLSTCQLCAPGQYNTQIGQTQCVQCAIGTFSKMSGRYETCEQCPEGLYSNSTGQTECLSCPGGRACNRWGLGEACAAGTFHPAGQHGECELCEPTTVSEANALACTSCPLGKYQDMFGQSVCKDCADMGWSHGPMFVDTLTSGSYHTFLQTSAVVQVVFELTPIQPGLAILNVGTQTLRATNDVARIELIPDNITPIRLDISSGQYKYREWVISGQTQQTRVVFNGETYVTENIEVDIYQPFTQGKYFKTSPDTQC